MPIEDRVTTLEQQFLEHLAGSNQQMAILNRVVSQQHLDLRDVEKNLTILLGIASGQEHSIKTMQADMSILQADVSTIKERLERVESRLERVETRLDRIDQRLDVFGGQLTTILALLTGKPPTSPEP